MEKIYAKALSQLGMSQDLFDSVVFMNEETTNKVVECLQYCFDNVDNVSMLACVLLQYIAERRESAEKEIEAASETFQENEDACEKHMDSAWDEWLEEHLDEFPDDEKQIEFHKHVEDELGEKDCTVEQIEELYQNWHTECKGQLEIKE